MIRAFIALALLAILGGGWYLGQAGVWGESSDLRSMRTGSAGTPYYGARSVK